MAKIFVSHRRKDRGYAARGISDALSRKFGKPNVYFDLDSILVGLDWRKQIDEMVAQCDVMVVVIGDDWLEVNESGSSRLADENDLVHFEVSTALMRDIPVIPVLVGNAKIPAKETLPETLVPLHYRHAVEVRADANFNAQIQELYEGIVDVAPPEPVRFPIWAYAIAAVAVVVAISWLAWQPQKQTELSHFSMPNVVGLTIPEAQDKVLSAGHTERVLGAKAYVLGGRSNALPAGYIVEQLEKAGTQMSPNDELEENNGEVVFRVVVSTGPVMEEQGIKITSEPAGAYIFIEGELVGFTPATLSSIEPDRTVKILLELEGYESIEQDVIAPREGLGEASFSLQKVFQEYALIINPVPTDATISFPNGELKYLRGMMLEPGLYDVEVSRDDYETVKVAFEVTDHDINLGIELQLEPRKSTDCDECPVMVVIPAGSFMMGGLRRHERPQHQVSVPSFAIGKYEVTFNEYDAFARSTGKEKPYDEGWGRGNRPVINVSWDDAQAYVEWMRKRTGKRYRMPSEAEWEYAARAGAKSLYWWGNDIGSNHANCGGCGSQWDNQQTSPVGSFPANLFGLRDMNGNVNEWIEDCWHKTYDGAPSNGAVWLDAGGGNCDLRVIRGGSWISNPGTVRSAERGRINHDSSGYGIGFRLAQDLPD